ncbi:MAG: cytochrome c3 family protein [Nitrospinota bacterium]
MNKRMVFLGILFGIFFLTAFVLGGGLAYSQLKDITFKGGDQGPAIFSHKGHVAKGAKCTDCHPKIFKLKAGATGGGKPLAMKDMEKGKFCGSCHNGKKSFDVTSEKNCARCHKK